MEQNSIKLTAKERQFLITLSKGGNKHDSDIAKETGISKPMISYMRTKLERAGVLTGSIPTFDLEKLGVCFYFVLIFQWNAYADKKLTKKMEDDFTSTPHTTYFAEGSNPNSKYIAKMAFLSFEEYNNFLAEFRGKYGKSISGLESFFIQPKRILREGYGDLARMLLGGA